MLQDKVAIITGASRGIGYAIAKKFAENGASVLIVALNEQGITRALANLREISPRVESINGDLADPTFAEKIFKKAIKEFGTVDILVNCAGTITRTPCSTLENEEWHRVINVNLHGAYYLCRQVLPVMAEKNRGKIINITSQMARMPHPNASPSYEVSKAGLAALTRHLALHYARHNICINAIAPGSIDTDMPKSMSPEARQKLKAAVPLQRLGGPSEVADLALFLASEKSDYITGSTMNINGGSWMD